LTINNGGSSTAGKL